MKRFLGILFTVMLCVISAIALADLVGHLSGHSTNSVLLAEVVVGGQFTDKTFHFRRGLGKKVEKLVWYYGKWAKFIGFIDVQKYKKAGEYAGATTLKPTGNLVDVVKDFEREGGIYMDMPISAPLTGIGRVGKQGLEGHEEQRVILAKKIAINQLRHAVQIQDNKMSKQMLAKPLIQMSLMERGAEDLKDWFSRKLSFFPYFALFTGYSDNLTHPTDGVNKTQRSHPNFYVKGYGTKVPFNHIFDAAYETAVAAALSTLDSETEDGFSMKSLRDLSYLAAKHKILKIPFGQYAFHVVFIHSAQMRQLRRDPEFIEYFKFAADRGKDNPLFTGVSEGIPIESIMLYVDDTIPAARLSQDDGYDATRGTINYGLTTYMANPRDVAPRKIALLCGAGAVTGGYGSALDFSSRTADYGQFLGDAADMMCGFERGDIIDDDNYFGYGAGAVLENASSIAYATYSPDELTDI